MTTPPSPVMIEPQPASMRSHIGNVLEQAGMLLVLGLLIIGCSLFVKNFFSVRNLDSILLAVSTVGIIACTMLFCLASGNFDLSVGTIVPAAAGVTAAIVINHTIQLGTFASIVIGVATALALGTVVGLVNGVVVAKLKINPLITTLATMQIVKGVGLEICDGRSVSIVLERFNTLGNLAFPVFKQANGTVVFQITVQVWICLLCFLVFGFLLNRTIFGRNVLAIGGNEEAARLAGIKTDRTKIIIFVMQGIIAALAGVIVASRQASGQPKSFDGLELQVISACVLGGVSLSGGVGKMSFVIAGVFIMGVVQNAMQLKNLGAFAQYIVSGSILLAAVIFDRLKQR